MAIPEDQIGDDKAHVGMQIEAGRLLMEPQVWPSGAAERVWAFSQEDCSCS